MKQNRRQCREEALQIVYSLQYNERSFDEVFSDTSLIRDDGSKLDEFTVKLARKSILAADECDKLIETHSSNWSFERIALMDLLILRLAVTEFLYFLDIPPKVTINEALEISKKYSTSKSSMFLNGVLDSVRKELEEKHKILKEGRGLQSGKE